MTSALIFDCDGTLTDSMPLHYRAWQQTLADYDVDFTEKTFYELAGVPSMGVIAAVAGHLSQEQAAQITADREAAFFKMLDQIEPIKPVIEIARSHRDRMKMAVASGSLRESVHCQLNGLEILDWFQAIVTAEDTERHKPEPDVFLEAARRLGTPPSECRVYEDSDLGLEAARRAGMEAVDIRPLRR